MKIEARSLLHWFWCRWPCSTFVCNGFLCEVRYFENADQKVVVFRGLGDSLYSRGDAFDAVFLNVMLRASVQKLREFDS